MKTKIEELTDEQLDHFCAIAQGWHIDDDNQAKGHKAWFDSDNLSVCLVAFYRPTTTARQCMAIQEREKISVNFEFEGCWSADNYNIADDTRESATHGTTAKQAIIRCFVKSELGEEVDCE